VENLLPELDQPGEFWYNHSSRELFVYPNATADGDDSWKGNFRLAMIENIIELRNVSYVSISGIGFRDSAASFMSEWSAPSGGGKCLVLPIIPNMLFETGMVTHESAFC